MNTTQFNELLGKSGIVSSRRAQELATLAAGSNELAADARLWAGWLVKKGVLTKFQAERLLQGKWRNFVVNGKYIIQEQLGGGGMGVVFKAQHLRLGRPVALKILNTEAQKDPAALQRFMREARAGAMIDHPNVVRTLDIEETGGQQFLVLEYMEGDTLEDLVRNDGPLPLTQAVDYVIQAAQGLQAAHEAGLVHRDIKPANLFLDRSGTVKILDLGLARLEGPATDGVTEQLDKNRVMGSADYIAPEQAIGHGHVDIRADLYGLGGVFFFLLIGEPPFARCNVTQKLLAHQMREPPKLKSIRAKLPTGLCAVVDRMLAKDPNERYNTPAEVVAALTPWSSRGKSAARVGGTLNEPLTPGRSLAVLGVVMTAVVLAAVGWMWYSSLPSAYEYYFDAAKDAAAKKDWDAAKQAYVRALAAAHQVHLREQVIRDLSKHEPLLIPIGTERADDPILQERCGEILFQRGQWANAEPFVEQAVKLRPKDPRLWELRRDVAVNLGKWPTALDSLTKLVQLDPNNHVAWYLRGMIEGNTPEMSEPFRSTCSEMMVRFIQGDQEQAPLEAIAYTAWLVTMHPDALPDLNPIDRRLRAALAPGQSFSWQRSTHGAVLFRLNRGSEARPVLNEAASDRNWVATRIPLLFLALLDLQEGQVAKAKKTEADIAKWMKSHRENKQGVVAHISARVAWWDWLSFEILLAELQRKLGTSEKGAAARGS